MLIQDGYMKLVVVMVGVALLGGGCEQRNAKKCDDSNHCPDPALPFCDVNGELAGEPRQCIAVSCAADEFEACRGDQELRCNANGDNYDVVKCELGCEGSSGCRLCEPNQTQCTNGRVGVCDASGNVVSMETCALGCFEDQPRCRDIDPSNALAAVIDQVDSPADLDLVDAIVQTQTGIVTKLDGTPIPVTSFLTGSAPGIRVIVARNVRISNVIAYRDQNDAMNGSIFSSGPPLAIVATGSILVEGRITLTGGAGGIDVAPCRGGVGNGDTDGNGHSYWPGAGGGGHATAGAKGGEVMTRAFGGAGGMPSGTDTLIPLRGGCPGGGGGYGGGGGAIQLSSRTAITVNGIIDARGRTPIELDGGGAGGGILIEAPKVTLTGSARLIAIGGGGGGGLSENHVVPDTLDDGMPAQGVACNPATQYCTRGGNGASAGVPATEGMPCNENTSLPSVSAGGGGGGLGRIRINTPDATYSRSSSTIEAGSLTLGILSTR